MVELTRLKGIGPAALPKLERLGITSITDLLFHLPLRYQDRTRLTPLSELLEGEAQVAGTIISSEVRAGRRPTLVVEMGQQGVGLTLRFFHFNAAQQRQLSVGRSIRCYGTVRRLGGHLEMAHPEYELTTTGAPVEVEATLTPIYPVTEGIQQRRLQRWIGAAVEWMLSTDLLPDLLVDVGLVQQGYPPLHQALQLIHHPTPDVAVQQLMEGHHPAQQRLAFEELVAHQLSVRRYRLQQHRYGAPQLQMSAGAQQRFLAGLGFSLTDAQQRVVAEILADLRQPHPMQRLVQGDVGSGKTVVAALAALAAVESGYQCAVMAPTELLAEQHYSGFDGWFSALGISTVRLSGRQGVAQRRVALAAMESGSAQVIIGTHALFQRDVCFFRLGLVVIDEQHRFGVHQRLALREKGAVAGEYPHQLVMTATPIPRTLAMTAYADLDISVIDQLPLGRRPIQTVVLDEGRRGEVIDRIRLACEGGQQAYWVCPLIEESDLLQCQAAEQSLLLLQQLLPGLRVGLVHGRMAYSERQVAMMAFKQAELDLLVATTVIEVGVDVPNASLMVIENSERLGLAQLHQLRGRVGRGARQSHCVLLYQPPLGEIARERLKVIRESNDGFVIAQRDLEIRGAGELLGTRQTGVVGYRIADLERDEGLLEQVAMATDEILNQQPALVGPLIQRWMGAGAQYGDV